MALLLKAKVAGFLQGGVPEVAGSTRHLAACLGTTRPPSHVFGGFREDDLHFPAAASQIIAIYGVLCRENTRTTASLAYKHISAHQKDGCVYQTVGF